MHSHEIPQKMVQAFDFWSAVSGSCDFSLAEVGTLSVATEGCRRLLDSPYFRAYGFGSLWTVYRQSTRLMAASCSDSSRAARYVQCRMPQEA